MLDCNTRMCDSFKRFRMKFQYRCILYRLFLDTCNILDIFYPWGNLMAARLTLRSKEISKGPFTQSESVTAIWKYSYLHS